MLQMGDTSLNFSATSINALGTELGSLNADYSSGDSVNFYVTLYKMDAENINAIKDDFDNFVDNIINKIKEQQAMGNSEQ